ncbi:MAG: molybdopterin-dependent oxidoreductase [Tagaea sp.]|nr:molybdopterin-dependent oxidoreductase [Tagaea sp.]
MTVYRHIGRRVPALDADAKARGRTVYTHDFALPDMLQGAILRSPHAHARIKSIDTSTAIALPGVRAVAVGSDYPGGRYLNFGPAYADKFPLAVDKVRFKGDEVAAIAADTHEQARAACAAIRVEYEVLPAVFDVDAALAADAPVLHDRPNLPPNVAQISTADLGGVDAAFAKAAFVIEDSFEHGIVAPICLETNAAVARFDANSGTMEIWAGTQAPFFARKEVAHVLGLPLEKVIVRAIAIGGGFGGKSQAPEPIAIAAMLAMKAGRPVKIVLDRNEEFRAGKTDHAKRMTVRTGVAANGTIVARHTRFEVDNGAYTYMGPAYVSAVRQRTCNLYRVGAAGFEGKLVHTNKVPGGSYRGMGAPQIIWAIETQIDAIARKLGKDRLDYRLEIANRTGDTTPQGWRIGACGLSECLREAGHRIGWAEKSKAPRKWRGLGIAAMINPSVGVLYSEGNFAHVSLDLRDDGTILLGTQTADCGTGQNTLLAQFAAEALDVPLEAFDVLHMDTQNAPDDLGSAASRVTFVSGAAAIAAGTEMAAELRKRMAARWNVAVDAVEFRDGAAFVAGDNRRRADLAEIAALEGPIRVVGRHDIDLPRADPKTGFGHYAPTYGFGAQACEVEIDPATGAVRILKLVSVQDIGRVVNPVALEGQTYGGIVQGIGMALGEELVFDDGEPVNASLIAYKVPRAMETPPIDIAFVETGDPTGPYGAKAGGEHPINATIAAIACAIADATGIAFKKLPISPRRILEALRTRDGEWPPSEPWRRPYNAEIAAVRALYPKFLFGALKKTGAALGRKARPVLAWRYERPADLDAAMALLKPGDAKIMAGGTDLQPGLRQGVHETGIVVAIDGIASLRQIHVEPDTIRIGAAATIADILARDDLARAEPLLRDGLKRIATRQIRNVATLGGDLCQQKRCWFFRSGKQCFKQGGVACPCYAVTGDNRHHAILGAARCAAPCVADAAPILVALGANLVAVGPAGTRAIPATRFYRWSGETVLAPDEILVEAVIPRAARAAAYEKFALWEGDFAEASAAATLSLSDGSIADVRIALGGVSPLPARAKSVEAALLGRRPSAALFADAARRSIRGALALRDNRFKTALLPVLVERALTRAAALA